MLELIFQGFIEWIYGLILEAWEHFASSLLDIMSMDFSYLEAHIAIIPTIRQAMLAIGWAFLLGNLIFQAAKSMLSGLGFEGEDPKLLFTRTFIFSFLLLASPQICDLCLNMTSKMIEVLRMPTAVHISLAEESSFAGLAGSWLLVTICGIIVMFQSFKLIIEMAERYFILAMLTISAPLAFGTGGSKNTSDIFSGWCRMYGSMCLLMVLNVVFIKMLLSVLSYVPSGVDVLPWMVLVLCVVKVAKKADAIITRIGLNPAMTGDSLGRSLPGTLTYLVARTAISNATRAIGSGGGKKGGAGGTRNGGPRTPAGGQTAAGSSARSTANTKAARSRAAQGGSYSKQSVSQAGAQQSATQQESQQQNTAAQYGGMQSSVIEQANTSTSISGNKAFSGTSGNQSGSNSRSTAIPAGTHRAPSHIKTPSVTSDTGTENTSVSQAGKIHSGNPAYGKPVGISGTTPRSSSLPSGTAGKNAADSGKAQTFSPGAAVGINAVGTRPDTRAAGLYERTPANITGKNQPRESAPAAVSGRPALSPSPAGQVRDVLPQKDAQLRQGNASRSGAAGISRSDIGKPGVTANVASPSAPSRSERHIEAPGQRNKELRQTNMPHNGTAGTATAGVGKRASDSRASTSLYGTAGSVSPSTGAASPNHGANRSGNFSSRPEVQPAKEASSGARKAEGTSVSGQRPVNSTMMNREQNHISVYQNSGSASTPPGAAVPAAPSGPVKEQSNAGGLRSTNRPPKEEQGRRPGAAAPANRTVQSPERKQQPISGAGTAETRASSRKAMERGVAGTGEKRRFPSAERLQAEFRPPAPARQEHSGVSSGTGIGDREPSSQRNQTATHLQSGMRTDLRGGMAGMDAQSKSPAQAAVARQTALGQAMRSSSTFRGSNQSGGKKTASAAADVNRRFSGKSSRQTKRSARKTGGKKRGKS